ncbi:eukaryotic translation initiation factor 3 subunit K-like [Teleopsis dalmanni]|uniref:eukaryotic translation initiation factor 3 subunit K-like n=1 Tax=Teleopsis dalmanni TaxID=139649 RepID=UPI0018CD6B4C|nr:eukaryotic translation initiation factor 3 subunit K-like [Teleopsis dalmanni]XP_037939455.1 eukaryotic translation initiation factor 3 subunit K-like [Teleopsis dalmanni]
MSHVRVAIPKKGFERFEKYNPENLKSFEQLIEEQNGDTYCLKLNMHLLRMYNAYPQLVNLKITRLILLKALSKLPYQHFNFARKYLIWSQLIDDGIRVIIDMADLLENEDYEEFWMHYKQKATILPILDGFDEAIRKYICFKVGSTRTTVPCMEFKMKLAVDKEVLMKYITQLGWMINGNEVKVFPLMLNDSNDRDVIRGIICSDIR